MSDRLTMPSALPADVAERRSDPTHLFASRPYKAKWVSAHWMRREIDAITAILKADNDEAEEDAR